MELVDVYLELGSYRAAAAQCRTTHKTVRRVIARWRAGKLNQARLRPPRARSTDGVRELIAGRVKQSRGRISAQLLLPALGAVARRAFGHRLGVRKASSSLFCAVLAWSRYRFVRFAHDEQRSTTLALLSECLEELGGAPQVVLSDRMAGWRAGTVANVVVPHPGYVRVGHPTGPVNRHPVGRHAAAPPENTDAILRGARGTSTYHG